ncbi:hypothetical protein DPMN_040231 [Dreissena polymorpha]|uniref:Uncharacterized protein n=1 Tax=Dreissena polymorpha TaxID=45954 RepID=A0A9D4HWN9_DREPO|nr:hypothetical protein DPMN_040231 [Dreissena polymorpha]
MCLTIYLNPSFPWSAFLWPGIFDFCLECNIRNAHGAQYALQLRGAHLPRRDYDVIRRVGVIRGIDVILWVDVIRWVAR